MKRKLIILFCIASFFCTATKNNGHSKISSDLKDLYLDFDVSMHYGFTQEEYTKYLYAKKEYTDISILKELYNSSNFVKKLDEFKNKDIKITTKIPKIIHQIWLGSPFPEMYKKYQESWIKHHPTWQYKLWTEKDLPGFGLKNQQLFDAAINYAVKSDIWRYEILERFGGVYIDADFECLRSLDILHELYDFYTGIATINRIVSINNAIIGSTPHHSILKECIKKLEHPQKSKEIIEKTGPLFFSRIIINFCLKNIPDRSKIAIMPPSYLYPLPKKTSFEKINDFLLPQTFAIHYWTGAWQGF